MSVPPALMASSSPKRSTFLLYLSSAHPFGGARNEPTLISLFVVVVVVVAVVVVVVVVVGSFSFFFLSDTGFVGICKGFYDGVYVSVLRNGIRGIHFLIGSSGRDIHSFFFKSTRNGIH